MEYTKKSRLKTTINAKDQDEPKTLSPTLVAVKRCSSQRKARNLLLTFCNQQPISKSMQIIINRKQQRVEEVRAFLTPGSPQLKSSDREQPRQGDLSLKRNRSFNEKSIETIKYEKSSPLKIELKSKLYERRNKK